MATFGRRQTGGAFVSRGWPDPHPQRDADSSSSGVLATSITWAHVVGGGDRFLLVGVSLANTASQTVSGVTYDSVALTLIGTIANGTASRVEIWGLIAPNTGSHNIVVSFSAAVSADVGASSWTNAHQTSPTGTFVSGTGSTASPTVSASSAVNEMVHDVVASVAASLTVDSSQEQEWNTGVTGITGAGSTERGDAGTVAMDWTAGSAVSWAIGAVPIRSREEAALTGGQTVSPGLIDQSAVVFAPQLNQKVSFGLIDQSATLFSPTITSTGGPQTISPGLIDQSAVVFAPSISQRVSVGLIDQSAVVFSPQINQTVTVGLIDQSAVLFNPVIAGGVALAAVGAKGFIQVSR